MVRTRVTAKVCAASTRGDEILVLPAWVKDRNVFFKFPVRYGAGRAQSIAAECNDRLLKTKFSLHLYPSAFTVVRNRNLPLTAR